MHNETSIKILVTGAAGFVGSHCVLAFLEQSSPRFEVIAIDNFIGSVASQSHTGEAESIVRIRQITGRDVDFYSIDCGDEIELRRIFRLHPDIKIVVHFAALKSVSGSISSPLSYYANNVTATVSLLQVMQEFGVKKIVFSSSATVYGDPVYLPIDEQHKAGDCSNPYGRTKYFVEEIIKDVSISDPKFGGMLLRYFNPAGAHPSGLIGEQPAGVPSNLMPYISQVAIGQRAELCIYGNDYDTKDGTGVRDYVHIMDIAKGHVDAVTKIADDGFSGIKVYNFGTGCGSSVLEMVRAFESVTGKTIPFCFKPRRLGDVASVYCSSSLAERELGWKAVFNVEDMCRDMWTWQSKNPLGYMSQ